MKLLRDPTYWFKWCMGVVSALIVLGIAALVASLIRLEIDVSDVQKSVAPIPSLVQVVTAVQKNQADHEARLNALDQRLTRIEHHEDSQP